MSCAGAGPASKKQKIARTQMMDGPALSVSRLTKHQLHLDEDLSPGALHSNRVAVQALASDSDQCYRAFFATGCRVLAITAPRSTAEFHGTRGKGNVYIPEPVEGAQWQVVEAAASRSEIQDVQLSEGGTSAPSVLACVDCYGRATLTHMQRLHPTDGAAASNGSSNAELSVVGVQQLQPGSVEVEAGWSGVTLAPGQPSQAAIARHFPKDVSIFDGPLAVRTIHTLYRPNAVQLLPGSFANAPGGGGGLAVAEGPMLSVWDLRGGGRSARVAKLTVGPHAGHLYSIATYDGAGGALLGAAGADRSVLVWDPRKWAVVDRWTNCMKYETTALHFSAQNSGYCIAGGLDYEVVCGRWGGDRRSRLGGGHRTGGEQGEGADKGGNAREGHLSFRGDSRWLGLARAQGQDVVAGVTSSCQLYVAELAVR